VIKRPDLGSAGGRHGSGRLSIIGAVAASAVGWILALAGLTGTIAVLPQLGWSKVLPVAALCTAPAAAVWMTRHAIESGRIRTAVPPPLLEQRYHGRLDVITDCERRALRPIIASAYEVATLTGELLADLVAVPGVRIFQGVRPAAAGLPLIPHAVSAGRHLVFIESVAWPPGRYETAENGRIQCDGMYIGQSVRPLLAAVQYWRKVLPRNHHVCAVVVVHPATEGEITLPAAMSGDLLWVHAGQAAGDIRQRMLPRRLAVSRCMLAALIAATADQA
jgi:hypothetical protein